MLYGNIVFIKKSGGDGSKYPVTEKYIKIGKSEECLIRIYNSQVEPVHCILIIDDNGQAKLRNLSSLSILNGKLSERKETILCHGDIIKLGERLARWEYLPTSKYYQQILSPSGRLVAVIMPQKRQVEQEKMSTPRMSRKTPVGAKREFSEKETFGSEDVSVSKKVSKIGSSSVGKTNKSVAKFLAGRHSLQSTKMLFSPKVKQRKSSFGVTSAKISKLQSSAKSRKSTLPSWKVNLISSPDEINSEERKTPLMKMNSSNTAEGFLKSVQKRSVTIQNVKKISDSPVSSPVTAKKSLNVISPVQKTDSVVMSSSGKKFTPKTMKLINSEKKAQSSSRKSSKSSKRLSLSFKSTLKTPTKASVKKMYESLSKTVSPSNLTRRSSKNRSFENVDSYDLIETPKNTHDKSKTIEIVDESQILSPQSRKSKKLSVKVISPKSSAKTSEEISTSEKKTPAKHRKTPTKPLTPFPKSSGKKLKKLKVSPALFSPVDVSSAKKFTKNQKLSKSSLKSTSPSVFSSEKSESILQSPYDSFSEMLPFSIKSPQTRTSVKVSTPIKVSTGKKKLKTKLSPILSPSAMTASFKKSLNRSSTSSGEETFVTSPGSTSYSKTKPSVVSKTSLSESSTKKSIGHKVSPKSKTTPKKKKASLEISVSDSKSIVKKSPARLKTPSKTVSPAKTVSKTPKIKKSPLKSKTPVKNVSHELGSPKQKSETPSISSTTIGTSPGVKSTGKKSRASDIMSPKAQENVKNTTEKKTPATLTPEKDTQKKKKKSVTERKSISEKKPKSPRGIRRKLSPSISSAERAAKKLKTSAPIKPDKNKKAALMVLGIANRKQMMSQNVKVLLKKKIVKKAIKQSTAVPAYKDEKLAKLPLKKKVKASKVVKKEKKKPKIKKKVTRSPEKSPKAPMPTKRKSETPVKETSKSQNLLSVQKSPGSARKSISEQTPSSSPSKSVKKLFSPTKQATSKASPAKQIPLTMLDAYAFNVNRRASKRLSSKNDVTRPDFTELSPTALGLIPKNLEIFKTPKEKKRRSSSLTTPKNIRTIIMKKSLSTSKIGNRKSVRFSSKDVSIDSPMENFNESQGTEFDFDLLKTPDITVDQFVSPLSEKKSSSFMKLDLNKSNKALTFADEQNLEKSSKSPDKVVQKTPSPKMSPRKSLLIKTTSAQKNSPKTMSIDKINESRKSRGVSKSPKDNKHNISGVKSLFTSPKSKSPKSPKTYLNKSSTISESPKSPKTDLSVVQDDQILRSKKVQSSPKNDLSDVRGVKRLLKTPKAQKSPKNDLSNVQGVKQLLKTPKEQKSPKNDLSDVRGVKQLLKTPKEQKSPKNDLSDVRGVKRLLQTPKIQKSPKNDLSNVQGVKRLMKTPKEQKSPKNDLSDVRGVKKLLQTPRVQKSPKNDLSNVQGVKQLLKTPKEQKSPKNDLSDLRGVRQLLGSPKVMKSPKNDLSDLTGVRKLLTSPRYQKSPKNDLMEVSGVENLFKSPNILDKGIVNSRSPKSLRNSLTTVTGVKQLLVSNSPGKLEGNANASVKSRLNSFKAIRGRRTIYSSPKGPKNDLSDLTGVKELFLRNESTSELNIKSSVAQLFDYPTTGLEVDKKEGTLLKTSTVRSRKPIRSPKKEEARKTTSLKSRLRGASATSVEKRSVSSKKRDDGVIEVKAKKQKTVVEVASTPPKKTLRGRSQVRKEPSKGLKKTKEVSLEKVASEEDESGETRSLRKRKASPDRSEAKPSKLKKKQEVVEEKVTKTVAKRGTSKKATSTTRQPLLESPKGETVGKTISRKVKFSKTPTKVQSKITTTRKTSAKSIPKVQKGRSQSENSAEKSKSSVEVSPRKTRSGKAVVQKKEAKVVSQKNKSKVQKKSVGLKVSKTASTKKKVSSAIKRSTRG